MSDYPYLEKILTARVYDVAIETPLDPAPMLSKRMGNSIFIKREDLQPVFSFKLRGAYNKISQLSDASKAAGVIAASAGNHAQGVALSAQTIGIKSTIVMPKTTPQIKVSAVRHHGGEVILHGNTYDEAYLHAKKIADKNGMTFVHPYDDPEVIAGQGTVAMEILKQHPDHIDAIFVPVGGGGLLAGIIAYVKKLRPQTKVIGVEPDDAACLYEALKANDRIILDSVGIFADGVAVRQIGEEPFRVVKDLVDEVVLASTDEICAGIKDIFDDTRAISEPAGALAIAGMKKYISQHSLTGKTFVAIDSGANMNFDRLRHVSERTELGEKREALLAVTIPEEPGSFRKFCHSIGQHNITEFNYRYADKNNACVFAGIQMHDSQTEKGKLIKRLNEGSYEVLDLSDNDMAKTHIRYMVGGHANGAENEVLYRFIFPERPGALLLFLTHISHHWNISLFHYRNHGAAYGRILVGIQVPEEERGEFTDFLVKLEYPFWDETYNPAYTLFLR